MKKHLGTVAVIAALGLLSSFAQRRLRSMEDAFSRELTALRNSTDRVFDGQSALTAETAALAGAFRRRVDDWEADLSRTERLHRLTVQEIESVRRSFARDPERLSREVLHPSVQVNGKGSVGGGTIIRSRPLSDGKHATYVVTAFHVVQKAVSKKGGRETRDPVEIRHYDGAGEASESVLSDLVAYDEKKDIALLCLRSEERYPNVARLASRSALREISVFTPIYAVGCPLGHDPLPSPGEISTLHKEVNSEKFWMMNAPTIFGNSGGGVFHRETLELVGVSAMICTFDGFVSTPVPHLGILVSLLTLYDWLDSQYLQFVYDPETTPERCERMRQAAKPGSAKTRIEY